MNGEEMFDTILDRLLRKEVDLYHVQRKLTEANKTLTDIRTNVQTPASKFVTRVFGGRCTFPTEEENFALVEALIVRLINDHLTLVNSDTISIDWLHLSSSVNRSHVKSEWSSAAVTPNTISLTTGF